MSLLERYAKMTHDARGLLHQRNLAVLRNYIKTSSEDDMYRDIWQISDMDLIKTLWEAGLSKRLQDRALQRYEYLLARRY